MKFTAAGLLSTFESYLVDDRMFRVHTWPGQPETKRKSNQGRSEQRKQAFYAKQRRKASKSKS